MGRAALDRAALVCAALGCLSLAGCKLVDQRTFDRDAGRAPVPRAPPQAAKAAPALPPLMVVKTGPQSDAAAGGGWQADLRSAVGEALERKPNVLFTVETVVPEAASPGKQAESIRAAIASQGRPVADAIIADGAAPSQVEMTALTDPAVHAPEVRIFVR